MEPAHIKEALSLLDRVYLFTIQTNRDKLTACNWRYYKQGWRHYYSFKEFFSSICAFYKMFMLYWSSRVKNVFILNIAYFLTPFFQKMTTYLDRANKKVKSLKIDNFDQTSGNRTPPNNGQFWPDPSVSAIQRFDCNNKTFQSLHAIFQVRKLISYYPS